MSQYLPLLACPLMMGAMMLFLGMANRKKDPAVPPEGADASSEVADLKAEIDSLRGELRDNDRHTTA